MTVIWGIAGAAIGSFLNVCIDRLPAGKSISYPPSHCDACQHRLLPNDLIPVFSYLSLRGRCRYCHAPIPLRVPVVELGAGLLFAFLYWHYGLTIEYAITVFFCCLFIVLMVIDLERGLLPNKIIYPGAVAALIISIFWPQSNILSGLLGGISGFVFFLLLALVSRGGIGWGDVKLAALIGLVTGFPLVTFALFIGILMGGIIGAVLLLSKIKKRKDAIPFGPFLSIATIITLLWGNNIVGWYLGIL